ncbi:hypothetical protein [Bordetella bronchialis]|uniref:Uncharacterized protein n=1 Tax=Bordetella bronchialis TaxID=463025 RepID=A0ABN4R8V9_9BORD|nr:hypothetical protein [Bordetella bronchialis]ANN67711.1 hypothetical protein BAU06_16635 [Bordetella bronchialis]
MMTSGTLGAALSTAIWAAIAGAAWAAGAARVFRRHHLARLWAAFADAVGWVLIVLVPQGLRLWGPKALVQRYLPHTLTVIELALLIRIAAVCGLVGICVSILYRLDRRLYARPKGRARGLPPQ